MNRLSSAQIKRRDELVAALEAAEEKLRAAVETFNDQVGALFRDEVQPVVEAMNDAVTEANDFREEVSAAQSDYFADRSEKWQEGDKGQAYQQWIDAWIEEIEAVVLDEPIEMDEPDLGASSTLQDLPEDAG